MSTLKSGHPAAVVTRSSTAMWLIGQPVSSIEQPSQLPAIGVFLRRLFFEMKSNKEMLSTACNTVVDEVMTFWVKANIPTSAKPNVVAKLKSVHHDYIRVCKNKHRRSATQMGQEADLTLKTSQLFDIAHDDWERRVKIPEDRHFLIDQRGVRNMSMIPCVYIHIPVSIQSYIRTYIHISVGIHI